MEVSGLWVSDSKACPANLETMLELDKLTHSVTVELMKYNEGARGQYSELCVKGCMQSSSPPPFLSLSPSLALSWKYLVEEEG